MLNYHRIVIRLFLINRTDNGLEKTWQTIKLLIWCHVVFRRVILMASTYHNYLGRLVKLYMNWTLGIDLRCVMTLCNNSSPKCR